MATVIVGLDFFRSFFNNMIDKDKEKDYNVFVNSVIKKSDYVYDDGKFISAKEFLK